MEFIWRAAGCPEPTVTAEFEDVPPYVSCAKAVSWALEKGIANGSGSLTFSPNQICSRGKIITFLYREAVEPVNAVLPSREAMLDEAARLINEERAKQGLSPLSIMPNLTGAVNIRAPELVTLFSHNRPNGTQCCTALGEAGITSYRAAGENITAGYATPEAVMNGWMNSPGHKANILDSRFTHIGVGYYNGCWVQMFIGTR